MAWGASERAQLMADVAMQRLGERLRRDNDYRCWRAWWSDSNIYNRTTIHLTIYDAGLAELKITHQWKRNGDPPGPFTTVRVDDIEAMIEAAENYVGGDQTEEGR